LPGSDNDIDLQATWQSFLDALESADLEEMRRLVEESVAEWLATLSGGLEAATLRKLAAQWRMWRFRVVDGRALQPGQETVQALLGPEGKEHVLTFRRAASGWVIEHWQPGL